MFIRRESELNAMINTDTLASIGKGTMQITNLPVRPTINFYEVNSDEYYQWAYETEGERDYALDKLARKLRTVEF